MARNESAREADGIHSCPLTLPRHDGWIEDTQEEREKDEVGGLQAPEAELGSRSKKIATLRSTAFRRAMLAAVRAVHGDVTGPHYGTVFGGHHPNQGC